MRKFELKEEYSSHFDELRKNRMEQSFYKYGPALSLIHISEPTRH